MSAPVLLYPNPALESQTNFRRTLVIVAICLGAIIILGTFAMPIFATWRLEDFANTFYPAAHHLLRGENVYLNAYPHPTNGRQYPPYAPIWILFSVVPMSVFPLPVGEALRFLSDVALLPFLAYLGARWARLQNMWLGLLLVLAPWHLTEVSTGQWSVLVFLGVFLCYWAARRANPMMMAAGLWLILAKPNIVVLVILASVVFAWRAGILAKTMMILAAPVTGSFLAQPGWVSDLVRLYVDRLAHPRTADSVLLLPGYPWSQLVLMTTGALFLILCIWRFKMARPTPWLWAVVVCVSLVGALHTFVYDWQLLMLPLALLVHRRWGVLLTLALYLYALCWAILALGLEIPLPSPAIIPSVVLLAVLVWGILPQPRLQRAVIDVLERE